MAGHEEEKLVGLFSRGLERHFHDLAGAAGHFLELNEHRAAGGGGLLQGRIEIVPPVHAAKLDRTASINGRG